MIARAIADGNAVSHPEYFSSVVNLGPGLVKVLCGSQTAACPGKAMLITFEEGPREVFFLGRGVIHEALGDLLHTGRFTTLMTGVVKGTAQPATTEEREVYYRFIPWEIEGEPVTVIRSGSMRLLMHLEEGRLFWLDLLNEYPVPSIAATAQEALDVLKRVNDDVAAKAQSSAVISSLTARFGPAEPYPLDSDQEICPLQWSRGGQPRAVENKGGFTARQWKADEARQIVLFERDGQALAIWFLADAVAPGERKTTSYPGAREAGWLETDISAVLRSIGWDRLIGTRVGCPSFVLIHTGRSHTEEYFSKGVASVTRTNLQENEAVERCAYPSYHRFLISLLDVRSGRVSKLVPAAPPKKKEVSPEDDPLGIEDLIADEEARPRIQIDSLEIRVSPKEYSGLHEGDRVDYAVNVCGRVVGLWPPRDP